MVWHILILIISSYHSLVDPAVSSSQVSIGQYALYTSLLALSVVLYHVIAVGFRYSSPAIQISPFQFEHSCFAGLCSGGQPTFTPPRSISPLMMLPVVSSC